MPSTEDCVGQPKYGLPCRVLLARAQFGPTLQGVMHMLSTSVRILCHPLVCRDVPINTIALVMKVIQSFSSILGQAKVVGSDY